MFNFDKIIERYHTDSVKYDGVYDEFGCGDILPMWVADMDFQAPPAVMEAIREYCDRGVFGYTFRSAEANDAFRDWVKRRYGWDTKQEWLSSSPGIVTALSLAVRAFTQPGERVLIMTPVYPPFYSVVRDNGRKLVYNPLIREEDKYVIDWENLEEGLRGGVRLLILCNSHNPVGRVWTREELQRIGELCCRYDVLIVSDEIHADLALFGHRHTVMASVSDEIAYRTLTAMAPSKTFNIAGIVTSYSIIPNAEIREKFYSFMEAGEFNAGTIFAYTATEAAYTYGAEWLQQMRMYITENVRFVDDYCKSKLPKIKVYPPQASFLVWLDCRDLKLSQADLVSLFQDKAGLLLNDGSMFGPGGEGHMRLNIGCPRSVLSSALDALKKAIDKK